MPRGTCRPVESCPQHPPLASLLCSATLKVWRELRWWGLACQHCPKHVHTCPGCDSTQVWPQLCSEIRAGTDSREKSGSGSKHFQAFKRGRDLPKSPRDQGCLGPQLQFGWLQLWWGRGGDIRAPSCSMAQEAQVCQLGSGNWPWRAGLLSAHGPLRYTARPRRVGFLPAPWSRKPRFTAMIWVVVAAPRDFCPTNLEVGLSFVPISWLHGVCSYVKPQSRLPAAASMVTAAAPGGPLLPSAINPNNLIKNRQNI